jgi:hypothetical protein
VNIAGIEVSEILSVAVRKAREISKNAGAMIVALLLPLAVALGFQYYSSDSIGVNIVEPNTSPSISPSMSPSEPALPNDKSTPNSNNDSTPISKPSSDEGQTLKNGGVISRKSAIEEVSPTLIMSDFPFNADGLILTSDNPNVTTAILTSFEGDKVEVVVSRDQSRIEIQFKLLIRGSSPWQSVEIVNLERTLTSSGGLVINAIVVDSEGKKWGVSIVFDAGYTLIINARIVGI